ncbi:MAG: glycosyl hydrolase [Halobacteriaceae archaeon]
MTSRKTDGPDGVPEAPLDWPAVTTATKPWTRWWWLGDAVDDGNLERELSRLDEVGIGGVEVTPIYEVEGEEHVSLDFLSEDWIERFEHTVAEATRRGMGVDAVPGTGWHFGGPNVDFEDSAMKFDAETTRLDGDPYEADFDPDRLQTVMAYSEDGRSVELTEEVDDDGQIAWRPDEGEWSVVAIVGEMGRDVKRAAPDREGPMVSPFYPAAMRRYLGRFDAEFAEYDGPPFRGTFHDSFEFQAHWSPLLLDAFEEDCGYRLQDHLPELLGNHPDEERVGRVKADYRRVLSDLYSETISEWLRWNHEDGRQARFQAHCAPGNILDLYALADIPETEFIDEKRNILGSKLSSSAAHVTGSRRASAETATWLDEHFTVSLGQLKEHVDELFLSGVNHVVFHGTAYAPDDAPWPGWLFYAATQLNPRNPIWKDLPALTEYVTRCQSVLQSGDPDADVLLYWNVEDVWHAEDGFADRLSVLQEEWFESYSFGRVARWLWEQGYSFDFVSDRQLQDARVKDERIVMPGGEYETVVVPETAHAPVDTAAALRDLADAGATVAFESEVPDDVPGLGSLDERRDRLAAVREDIDPTDGEAEVGDGRVLVGDVPNLLPRTDARREALVDEGLKFVRRTFDGGTHYFLVNTGESAVEGWVPLAVDAADVARFDPMSGETAPAAVRESESGVEVYCQLHAGDSVVLRAFDDETLDAEPRGYWHESDPIELDGPWSVEFIRGGPERPPGVEMDALRSWTEVSDMHERFAGTARYETTFDRPESGEAWWLDLGDVADSATVWLNGEELGTALRAPFRIPVDELDAEDNTLHVEVTSRAANRVRDLDRRGVDWKRFGDINLVGRDYEPFDASDWDVRPAGLLGPVTLVPREAFAPGAD